MQSTVKDNINSQIGSKEDLNILFYFLIFHFEVILDLKNSCKKVRMFTSYIITV